MRASDYLLWALAFGVTGLVIFMFRLMNMNADAVMAILWAAIAGPIVMAIMLMVGALIRRLNK